MSAIRKNPRSIGWIILACVCLYGCGTTIATSTLIPTPTLRQTHFQLAVVKQDCDPLFTGATTQAEALAILGAIHPDGMATLISEDDVSAYWWADQRLTLTPSATDRVTVELGALHKWLLYACFVVSVDDIPLYGGKFLPVTTAYGAGYPVIQSWTSDGSLLMQILPGYPVPASIPESAWGPVKDDRIKHVFESAGKLR